MPWKKSFDRKKALKTSMRVFWEKGYARTSYADIVKSTKASRDGLYDEFGDLDEPQAVLTELRNYFARMVAAFQSGEAQKGCLMSLSAIDLAPHDHEVADLVRMRTLYARALTNAQDAGDWPLATFDRFNRR